MRRRDLAAAAAALAAASRARAAVARGNVLRFPRDHGAHLDARIEWWYVTGWLGSEAAPRYGFQITFFRTATGLAADLPGRFAARQVLLAHAAVTDLQQRRHRHQQRMARWNGAERAAAAWASTADTDVALDGWTLSRATEAAASRYRSRFTLDDTGGAITLEFRTDAPPLLQGDAGYSRKGPLERHASHYVSEPQLATRATLADGSTLSGRAWLDHEWSDELLADGATGWDWIGINLFDGSALTAFRLRRRDGSVVWAGGSWRGRDGASRAYTPQEVSFSPGRTWRSPTSGATYPMEWQIDIPGARYRLRSLLDNQELDALASTGSVYWEGLSELLDANGRQRLGLGYLEMTGYAGALKLG